MDIAQLETFLTVAEEHGFSRAAHRLHRTQPAISQVIRKLEEELNEPLFERSSRDGTLTAAGEVLREYARRMVSLRAEAERAVGELKSFERGRLQLAANEYTCMYLLRVLDRFRRQFPQVTVTVRRALASRIPDEILRRTAEIGVLSFRPEGNQFRSVAVYTDKLAFVVGPHHPLAGKKSVSIEDLASENFVAHNVPSPLRQQVISTFAKHNTPLNMGVELPSLEAVKRFVAMGNGVAFVPSLIVEREAESGELVKVTVQGLRAERQLRLVHRRRDNLSHAATAFLKVVHSVSEELQGPFDFRIESPDRVAGEAGDGKSKVRQARRRP